MMPSPGKIKMSKITIIGAGAAGLMAALSSTEAGNDVTVFEHNEKPGKKIYITGKGRCNLLNNCSRQVFIDNVVSNNRFLYSASAILDPAGTIALFERLGLKTVTERGNRVYPESGKASDVTKILVKRLNELGVNIEINKEVASLITEGDTVKGVRLSSGEDAYSDAVILATGGLSYSTTGSTGDGLRMAEETGHKIIECIPSLTGINIAEDFCKKLQGLSLKNVMLRVLRGQKEVYREQGEMLFTHYGISGPLVLTVSSVFGREIGSRDIRLSLDMKPALSEDILEDRLIRDIEKNRNKSLSTILKGLMPYSMAEIFDEISGIDRSIPVNVLKKEDRKALVKSLKNITLTPESLRGFEEAVITKGGVSVKDIDPGTMESKKVRGLYFAGEIMDVDALTGGFNLQIAWSTGYLAGISAGSK